MLVTQTADGRGLPVRVTQGRGMPIDIIAAGANGVPVTVVPFGGVPVQIVSGAFTYATETTAALAAMSVQPNATRASLIDGFIVALKADGIWAKLDWMSLFAAHDAQAALVNLKTPAQVAAIVGAPTFTVDRGYKGDGSTGYLNTGVNDSATVNSVQDSSTLGAWANIAPTITAGLVGSDGGQFNIRPGAGLLATLVRVHAASGGAGLAGALGANSASRVDSSGYTFYVNGSPVSTTSVASAAPTANPIFFLRSNTLMTDAQLAAGWFGAGLSAAENNLLYIRLREYLLQVGGA